MIGTLGSLLMVGRGVESGTPYTSRIATRGCDKRVSPSPRVSDGESLPRRARDCSFGCFTGHTGLAGGRLETDRIITTSDHECARINCLRCCTNSPSLQFDLQNILSKNLYEIVTTDHDSPCLPACSNIKLKTVDNCSRRTNWHMAFGTRNHDGDAYERKQAKSRPLSSVSVIRTEEHRPNPYKSESSQFISTKVSSVKVRSCTIIL